MGKLYVVATPLGNLEDITARALSTLRSVELVYAEDSRMASKLLSAYDISVPIQVYNQHSSDMTRLKISEVLKEDISVALITDAGTPGISDPGNELISFLVKVLPDLEVIPVPGPSSVTALLSVSGFPTQKFLFIGFLPKKKRQKLFSQLKDLEYPFVFFDSPHRILKTLKELQQVLSEKQEVVLGRELTKMHETIYRGTLKEVFEKLGSTASVKGEIVAVVNSKPSS